MTGLREMLTQSITQMVDGRLRLVSRTASEETEVYNFRGALPMTLRVD